MNPLHQLLKDLVSIDSSTKEGANEAVQFCYEWLKEKGLDPQILTNNGYRMLVCETGQGEKTIVLNGHVDVVSGNKDQFTPYEKEGRLYGRGSADMKAGVAAMMAALEELRSESLFCKVQLQIVSDEEIGGINCSSFLVENGFTGDFVICGEPTQLGIGLQAKGILQLDIEVEGESAHGSRPWEGKNAIVKAYELYQQILSLPFTKDSSEFYLSPSINLAKISGGTVYNKVPDLCTMSLDIRFLPQQSKEEILKQIQNITDARIHIHHTGEPVKTRKEDPYVQALIKVLSKKLEKAPDVFGQHGAADALYFAKKGIPAIEFGPAGAAWHGDLEYVELQSVEAYKNILKEYVFALTH
ncbi:M20 family metallopeptidase [Heyndrickxia acidicola]|uniref:M20/M25/M40 family metallo-hydrolase n=1 Tax=Heyndrickxia acidicola TaxID=209389 RepID=A0ABU6MIC9_9BACI|nr:M20/M25/M40 family metallo-hydrolase [Heyndrickxia acidicola]MED1203413.1 M20/M25/M40 family metallo-hydrolase [Heyndrickxia acidicola]